MTVNKNTPTKSEIDEFQHKLMEHFVGHAEYWTHCPLCKDRNPYEMEHPDFKMPEDINFPEGFEDYSWHNDEYPHWQFETDEMDVYHAGITILYPRYESENWESIQETGIYIFETTTAPGGFNESDGHDTSIIQTNDWNEIIKAFESWNKWYQLYKEYPSQINLKNSY
tara:strand:+ start:1745 stop:2248 length:504 start_codon:yes stop_codon:yes gene_type:complete